MPTEPVFATGTTATIKSVTTTTPASPFGAADEELENLRGVGSNDYTISFSDVSNLQDKKIRRRPARLDPGTVQFTFTLHDDAEATDNYGRLVKAMESRARHIVTINLPPNPGSKRKPLEFEGYFSNVTTPDIAIGDEVLTFTASMQLSGE